MGSRWWVTIFTRPDERVSWLNDSDPAPEKRVSPVDHPQRFVVAMTYELPVGKGRALNVTPRWANAIVGGWLLNNVYTYQIDGRYHLEQRQHFKPWRLRVLRHARRSL